MSISTDTYHANQLTPCPRWADNRHVPDKEGAGRENPNYLQRTDGAMPFFYVRIHLLRLHWAALMGAFGLPVAVGTGFSTHLCCPPRLRTGSGLIATYGGLHA